MHNITISPLPHTWLIDIDGTLMIHNGHKHGDDVVLDGVKEFFATIPAEDKIILLSARTEDEKEATLNVLNQNGLRYDEVIFGLPTGERILINDAKPSGLKTALEVNIKRDVGLSDLKIEIDPSL